MLGFLAIIVLLPAMRSASLVCGSSSVMQQIKVPRLLEISVILRNLSSAKKSPQNNPHLRECVFCLSDESVQNISNS